jgi:paraquat-inducible protein A
MASQRFDPAPQQATDVAVSLTACPECDLLQKLPPLAPGARLRCPRCRCILASRPPGHSDLPLALTCTAALVYLVANLLPLMGLSVVGRSASTTIIGGAYEMWQQGQMVTAVLVAFCAVIAPGCYIAFVLVLLLGSRRSPVPPWVGEVLRWVHHLQIWSMLEVMLLGIMVALVKIAELATVTPDFGLYSIGALVVLIPAIQRTLDIDALWERVQWAGAAEEVVP